MRWVLIALITLVFLGLGFGYQFYSKFGRHPLRAGEPTKMVIEIPSGASWQTVVGLLNKNGLVENDRWIYWYGRLRKVQPKAAEYEISSGMTVDELLARLQSGVGVGYSILIPEGYNIFEIAKIFEEKSLCSAQDFLKWVRQRDWIKKLLGEDLDSLEGYLFPDTYSYTKKTSAKELIQKMVEQFLLKYEELKPKAKQQGWTRHELVTMASIVEKETGAPWERPLIAGVFLNRLQKNMRLQTDPTILYAKALLTGVYEINITRNDLSLAHPYNTYYRGGLPPGPIANPGLEALKAVLNPQKSNYLYFVSRNDGTHIFSETYEEHLKAVKIYQLEKKNREGKSWRDLQKKLKQAQ